MLASHAGPRGRRHRLAHPDVTLDLAPTLATIPMPTCTAQYALYIAKDTGAAAVHDVDCARIVETDETLVVPLPTPFLATGISQAQALLRRLGLADSATCGCAQLVPSDATGHA